MSTVLERIREAISRSEDAAFLRSEFAELGSARQVSRALKALVDAGELVRVGSGLYAKARRSALSGRPIPADQLIEIGLQIMRKRGIRADVGRAARAYRDGKTTQMPMRCVMAVWDSRTAVKIGFRARQIEYEYEEESCTSGITTPAAWRCTTWSPKRCAPTRS